MKRFAREKKIVCIGDICPDVFIPYGEMKETMKRIAAGEQCDIPTVVSRAGGSIANTASTLGKLGMNPIFVGKLGRDRWGDFLKENIASDGVDTRYLCYQDEGVITVLAVLDEKGERVLFAWLEPGAKIPEFLPEDFPDSLLCEAGWVHTSGLPLKNTGKGAQEVVRFLERCHEKGIIVSLDLNLRIESFGFSPERKALIQRAVEASDIVMGSGLEELGPLTGLGELKEAARALSRSGCVIIARDGKNPVMIIEGEKIQTVPAYDDGRAVVSTVGAGDTFNGGFIAAATLGMPYEEAVRWGNICAHYRITREEHRAVPHMDELKRMSENYLTGER